MGRKINSNILIFVLKGAALKKGGGCLARGVSRSACLLHDIRREHLDRTSLIFFFFWPIRTGVLEIKVPVPPGGKQVYFFSFFVFKRDKVSVVPHHVWKTKKMARGGKEMIHDKHETFKFTKRGLVKHDVNI